jgi:hypothetical protein
MLQLLARYPASWLVFDILHVTVARDFSLDVLIVHPLAVLLFAAWPDPREPERSRRRPPERAL